MKKIISFILLLTPLYCLSQGTVIRTAPVSSTISAPNYNKQVVQDANLSVLLTLSIPVVDTPKFNNANPRNGAMILATHDSSLYVFFNGKWRKASATPTLVGNGLSRSGDTVIMGGAIDRFTNIDMSAGDPIDFTDPITGSVIEISKFDFFTDFINGTDESAINFSSSGNILNSLNAVNQSSIFNLPTQNSLNITDGTNSSIVLNNPTQIQLSINNGITFNQFFMDKINGFKVIDRIALKGMSYDADYSANNTSNPRWVTDKGYVDGKVASLGGSNGITRSGNNFLLGGTLSLNTGINLDSKSLVFSASNVGVGTLSTTFNQFGLPLIDFDSSDATNTTSSRFFMGSSGISQVGIQVKNNLNNEVSLILTASTNIPVFKDNIFNKGLSYDADYSANNTSNPRWVTDKGYVDGKVSGVDFSHFIYNETPSGTINGSNVTFTLAFTPVSGKFSLTKNGLKLKPITDYTISGNTITYVIAPVSTPSPDILLADYIK